MAERPRRRAPAPHPGTGHDRRGGGPADSRSPAEVLVLTAGLVLLAALAYSVNVILSPFVLLWGLVYLLAPFRSNALASRLLWLGVLLFAVWFFYSILGLLAPFLLAFLIAYLFNPAVTALERRHVPRWLSSLVTVLLLIGVVVAVLLFVLPLVIQEFDGILSGLGQIANDVSELLRSGSIFAFLQRYGIPVEKAQEMITSQLSPRLEDLLKGVLGAVLGLVTGISGVVMQLVNAVIIPFLAFYLLMDFPVITHRFLLMVPRQRRDQAAQIAGTVDGILGNYFRGAITVAIIQGCISGLGLWMIGVDYSLVLGIMSGVLDFIPYVGLLVSLVVSSLVAIFSGGNILIKVIAVVILYLSQKLLEATVLAPKIIGRQVGLHPVLLILSLLVFGYFIGFMGLLIAVPATALTIALVKEWEVHRKAREA
jgi:predicted PurR-regulated permease PerM